MSVAKQVTDKKAHASLLLEEKKWVRLVREEEDRNAFEKIFRGYYKRLYHFACGYVGREEADDVVQSVFLKIWDQKENWDPQCTVKQYLFTAVRNEALNIVRHRKIQTESKETVTTLFKELKSQSYHHDSPETEKLRSAIQEGIDQLPPRCRQIFILNRKSGLTYSEIADVLDIALPTVGTQMGRALKAMEKHLSRFITFLIPILIVSDGMF